MGCWVAARAGRVRALALALPAVLLVAGCTSVIAGSARPGVPAPAAHSAAVSTARTTGTTITVETTHSQPSVVHAAPGPAPTAGSTKSSTPAHSTPPTKTTTPARTTAPDASHADVADHIATVALAGLASDLKTGDRGHFLQNFAEKLQTEVGDWFTNTRALGVSDTRFTLQPEASSQTKTKIVREFTLGVHTPFDNPGTMPGLRYRITMTQSGPNWQVTDFAPAQMSDPMYCVCHMTVDKRANLAIVHRGDAVLDAWPKVVLDKATESAAWDAENITTKGLQQPTGHVIFLADSPYKWFLPTSEPAQENNSTIPLPDSETSYSPVSRIVVMLEDSSGHDLSPNADAILYVWDVLTHEMVHQLFFLNSIPKLRGQFPDAPSWVAEGIAVAAETLHRRQHEHTGDGDFVFPLDDDIANVPTKWLAKHLHQGPPSEADLYSSDVSTADNWYAVAGSVFLWIQARFGTSGMTTAANSAFDAQDSVFDHIPGMSARSAEQAWMNWVTQNYLD